MKKIILIHYYESMNVQLTSFNSLIEAIFHRMYNNSSMELLLAGALISLRRSSFSLRRNVLLGLRFYMCF